MKFSVKIENLAQIKSALAKFPTIAAKYMDQAIKKSIFEIERIAKPLTPVDTDYLRRNYNSIFSPLKGILQPMASYAFWVEVGKGKHTTGQSHYFETGVNQAENAINKYFEQGLKDTLQEVARLAK